MLDIKFCFTCVESNLCQQIPKYYDQIVVFMLLILKVATTTLSPAHISAIRRRRIFFNCSGEEVVATTKTYFRHYDIGTKTMFYIIPVIALDYFRIVTHCYPRLFSIKTSHYETNNTFYVKN